jgi:phage protein U
MLLSLGDFRFSVETAAYDALDLNAEYPWMKVERVGNTPQLQAVGLERRTMTLKGAVMTTYKGGTAQTEALRKMAGRMEPLELVTGDGRALGKWCVTRINESDSGFFRDGMPKKQSFTMDLEIFGDE